MSAPRRRGGSSAGSALLEALVALAIAGVALLFLVGLLAHDLRLTTRAAAQREAFAALEAVVAGLRAGTLPLRDATWTADDPPPGVSLPSGRGVTLSLQIDEEEVLDLWTVRATVRYRAWNETQERTLLTRVWRPLARG